MLQNISWPDYILVVAILLVLYYLFIGLRYFSADLKELLAGKRKLRFQTILSPNNLNREQNSPATAASTETTDNEFSEVEHLVSRLKEVIPDASRKKMIPEEFKQYLHLVLKEYPTLINSPFRPSVNELIMSECRKHEAAILTEDEVDMLWNGAL